MTESRLTLTPVSEDDASHLICRVKNSMIPGAVMEDSVRLDVHCKSSLLLSPLIYYVTRAKLNCSVNFNIKDCFMYFARVSSSHFLSLFLSISLFYVLPLYRGLFAFIWKTERNDAARSHDSIDQDPPEVGIALGSNINGDDVKEGDDLYIECHIRANPSFHKLQWTHNVSRKKRKYIFLFCFFSFVLFYLSSSSYPVHNPLDTSRGHSLFHRRSSSS